MNLDPTTLRRMLECVGWNQHDLSAAVAMPRWKIAFFLTARSGFTNEERQKIATAILSQAQKNVTWLQTQFGD